MKLKCIKSVQMGTKETTKSYQAFTEGTEYLGREVIFGKDKFNVKLGQIRAINDKGEDHIIRRIGSSSFDDFFNTHFEVITQ